MVLPADRSEASDNHLEKLPVAVVDTEVEDGSRFIDAAIGAAQSLGQNIKDKGNELLEKTDDLIFGAENTDVEGTESTSDNLKEKGNNFGLSDSVTAKPADDEWIDPVEHPEADQSRVPLRAGETNVW